jgi:hypothetical protein
VLLAVIQLAARLAPRLADDVQQRHPAGKAAAARAQFEERHHRPRERPPVHRSAMRGGEVRRHQRLHGRAADQVVQLVLGIDQVLRGKAQFLVAGRSTGVSSMNMKAAAARATLAPGCGATPRMRG